jgi:hypothetical protein
VGQFEFALKGRSFSRAVIAAKSIAALAAAGMLSFKLNHNQLSRFLVQRIGAKLYLPLPEVGMAIATKGRRQIQGATVS